MKALRAYSQRLLLAATGLAALLCPITAYTATIYAWSYDGAITKFTGSGLGTAFANTGSSFNGSVGLAVDSAGNLFTGNPSDSTVKKFTPDGVASLFSRSDSISGLAFNSTGTLYGAVPNYNALIQFSPAGVGMDITDYSNGRFGNPTGIAIDSAGNLYVANHGYDSFNSPYANTIEKYSPTGLDLGTFAITGLNKPWGLAFDSAGNLFVSNSGNNTIQKFTPDGVRSVFASTGLNNPQGMAFDSAGNLYVANAGNNTIRMFTSTGIGTTFASGLNSPSSIAIDRTTPEPASALLLLLGSGLLSLQRHRNVVRAS